MYMKFHNIRISRDYAYRVCVYLLFSMHWVSMLGDFKLPLVFEIVFWFVYLTTCSMSEADATIVLYYSHCFSHASHI